jgi:glycosyltransferase involved in cell wall biosynthesis
MSMSSDDRVFSDVAVVIIGRNEGERLRRCLHSVSARAAAVIYIDSGSTDGSVEVARAAGANVVELDLSIPFTAARARNAGLQVLHDRHPAIEFVQMIDGDCELRDGWLDAALATLQRDPSLAVVFGRRREREPTRSIYNALCDDEWNIPIGEAAGCGGDALFRVAALRSASGYNDSMIAGEESELSMRMRKMGWRCECIDVEMTWHYADMFRFSQFWNRMRRSGHAYAEMAHRHPDARWPDWPRSCRSIVFWGGAMPLALIGSIALAILHHPLWLVAAAITLLPWPLKMTQLAYRHWRRGFDLKAAVGNGVLLMVGKLPQIQGLASFHIHRWRGRTSRIIEYKGPTLGIASSHRLPKVAEQKAE